MRQASLVVLGWHPIAYFLRYCRACAGVILQHIESTHIVLPIHLHFVCLKLYSSSEGLPLLYSPFCVPLLYNSPFFFFLPGLLWYQQAKWSVCSTKWSHGCDDIYFFTSYKKGFFFIIFFKKKFFAVLQYSLVIGSMKSTNWFCTQFCYAYCLTKFHKQIGGIGKVTDQILKNVFGITTCEEMLEKRGFLCALFSRTSSGLLRNNSSSILSYFGFRLAPTNTHQLYSSWGNLVFGKSYQSQAASFPNLVRKELAKLCFFLPTFHYFSEYQLSLHY